MYSSEEERIIDTQDKLDPRDHPLTNLWKRYIWQLRKRIRYEVKVKD